MPKQYFVIRIESYEGEDTYLDCGDHSQDFLFAVAVLSDEGALEIVDNGYRSQEEALEAWPQVKLASEGG